MRRLALVACAIIGVACGTTSTYRVRVAAGGPPSVRPAGAVQVLLEQSQTPSNYVEVAVVQSIGRGTHSDAEHVIDGLRAEAAALGCDAVIAAHIDSGATQSSGVGMAVRWRDGSAPASVRSTSPSAPWTPGSAVVPPWATTPP